MASRIFHPFRSIGTCSNGVPLSLSQDGGPGLVATAVGRAFHVYECNKLRLVHISQLQDEDINCLVQEGAMTYASVGECIKIFEAGKELGLINSGRVHVLVLLEGRLLTVTDSNTLGIWDINERALYTELMFDKREFAITSIVHPSTYLNKIIIGSKQGQLQLWNIRTSRLIYTFNGWGSAVLSLQQSPALDVLGVGLADGHVLIHNIREDRTLFQFTQDWGPVTGLAFRTDSTDTLVTVSGRAGHIALWDLNEKRLITVLRDAHRDSIVGVEFFMHQPLCITNSSDNSIKIWIFDQSDGSCRLLKERCGHSAPPTLIKFHPTNHSVIISAGEDRSLRVIALHRQVISRELSQGTIIKKKGLSDLQKLPPIIDFSCESQHQNEWDSIVTVHRDTPTCYTWNLINYSLGRHSIKLNSKPLCCAVSGCGNYMLLGTVSGRVQCFNIQSGLPRGELLTNKKTPAHEGSVRGVGVMLQYIITGGADGMIKVWSFQSKRLLRSVSIGSPVAKLVVHKDSGLVGVACDNFRVMIIDADTGRIVRTFTGPSGRITDMLITNDSRWLIVSCMDCSITTWDIPSGHKIDLFYCETPPTSIAMSSVGNFLASSHIDELGICLWSNSTLYSTITLSPLPEDYSPSTAVQLPSTGGSPLKGERERSEREGEKKEGPLIDGLVTLSSLSKSQWHCLQYMESVKERNKPKEPVQPAKPAPFFLPTLPGLELKFLPAPDPIPSLEHKEENTSKIMNSLSKSGFQKCLIEYSNDNDKFTMVMDMLKSMGPAAIDLEFQLLVPPGEKGDGDIIVLVSLLSFILEGLKKRHNFELIQSYLCLLLKYYMVSVLSKRDDLSPLIKDILHEHRTVWRHLSSQLNYCNTLLSYCKSATV